MPDQADKREDIAEVVEALRGLSPIQVEILSTIIKRFADEQDSELVRTDFLTPDAFEFFSVRLAMHHASSGVPLKKENFEHILEMAFKRAGVAAQRSNSMTERGADLKVGDVTLSLKTEAAKGLKPAWITISKLMEAAWIKTITTTEDIPRLVQSMVLPHFQNYDRIFILRTYPNPQRKGAIRYDLNEIPRDLLDMIGHLDASDYSALTRTRTTSADVVMNGRVAFKFRLDGSDDKLTITNLDVRLCPLHAWWSLMPPG
ncbi:hypothetical protein [Phaeovulum sp.]|uniref:hypothetical protein n=1 Tax=Phaeovulum sp. TaxID=2934796 RepID=UPI002730AD34|nr:hypothetical protein [Phaeovulum sp.]MDP1668828.1 hypothetical protein [Phaeovulum sp.]MDZ4119538.1 hypothetical protein [Phaeovulum sp.]